jgi:hypothetical protein
MSLLITNLSFAVHYCGGQVAATRVSFSGAKASCGMPHHTTGNIDDKLFISGICDDQVLFLNVDDNYLPSVKKSGETRVNPAYLFTLPEVINNRNSLFSYHITFNTGPPGNETNSLVDLSEICTLRI